MMPNIFPFPSQNPVPGKAAKTSSPLILGILSSQGDVTKKKIKQKNNECKRSETGTGIFGGNVNATTHRNF